MNNDNMSTPSSLTPNSICNADADTNATNNNDNQSNSISIENEYGKIVIKI